MTRTKIITAALAVLAIGATAAEAGCKPNQVASKTFVMSATDSGDVNKYFFMCGFTTSAAGTVSLAPAACKLSRGTDPDFTAPLPIDIFSGTLTQLPGGVCAFDVKLTLVAAAGPTMTGRVIFAGKTVATGSWVSSFNSWGSMSIMKQ